MLTFSQGLQMAVVVLGAVMLSLGVGFWLGIKSTQRPRLGGLIGFFGSLGLAFGPLAILAATLKLSLTACLATTAGWLVVSGLSLGVVISHFGKGQRSAFNVSFIQNMYLVGIGVVMSGLVINQVFYFPDNGPENIELWGRHIGVFSLIAMAYAALGCFVYWMYRWSRAASALATPLAPEEKFVEKPVAPKAEPAAKVDQVPADKGTVSPSPADKPAPPADKPVPPAEKPTPPADKVGGANGGTQLVPPSNTESGAAGVDTGRTKLILRDGEGKLTD